MIGRRSLCAALRLAAPLVLLAPAAAPAWEFAYGPPKTLDQAFRRVAPALICPGGGYIAVGTQGLGDSANPDVYVVRTNNAGWPLWEYVYDVESASLINEGIAVGEDRDGFMILSNTLNGAWYPALTRIDCDGRHVGTQAYRDVEGRDLWGRDLMRSVNGDWVVAGISGHSSNEDGFLMRTDANAAMLWHFTYHSGGREAFHAVAEAARLPGQTLPDLVAAGRFSPLGGDLQGLVARVAGDTGLMIGTGYCIAEHGWPLVDEEYNSVVRLRNRGAAGTFAMVGSAADDNDPQSDIWLVTGNPCTIASQIRIGTGIAPPTSEVGYDIREVLAPTSGVPVGSLAIAGSHQGLLGVEGALVFVSLGPPLAPIGGSLFGDFAFSTESFHSLAENAQGAPQPPGFILAGLTEADWDRSGDPRDLYLVHHDPAAAEACEQEWNPESKPTDAPYAILPKRLHVRVRQDPETVKATPQVNPLEICPRP